MAVFRDVRGRTVEAANFADFNALRDSGKLKGRFGTLASVSYVDKAVSHGSRMPLGRAEMPLDPEGEVKRGGTQTPPPLENTILPLAKKRWGMAITRTDRHAEKCELRLCKRCEILMIKEKKMRDLYLKRGGKLPTC